MTNKNTWDDLKLKKLEELWNQGHPISKIGEMLGVSRNSIACLLYTSDAADE